MHLVSYSASIYADTYSTFKNGLEFQFFILY